MKLKRLLLATLLLLAVHLSLTAGEVITVNSFGVDPIGKAIVKARPGDTILVADGTYKENIYIKTGVIVKAQNRHGAILDGSGHGTVVTLGGNSGIEGMQIQNGTIGVFCKSTGASIKQCKIVQNWMTGIITVRHLPVIEDNVIAFNRGSGIVGWNVRSTNTSVEHNTIGYNGGFGMYLGGSSRIVFENNIVAFNQKYGLKMAETSRESTIKHNNFWENLRQLYDNPEGNFSFDPAFVSPRIKMNFEPDSQLCCSVKSDNGDGTNLGARLGN